MVFPKTKMGPLPTADMPPDVLKVYEEARTVAWDSPRAAAALLRVSVQMLVDQVLEGSDNLNAKIGTLVKEKGLPPEVQQMLDAVRVIGNEGGAHPGEIDMDEQPNVLTTLMFCVNTIVERMITHPKRIAEVYATLPESKRQGIKIRDKHAGDR
jgi:hypothetical protein